MTVTHIVHPLCFVLLAPVYLLGFGVVSSTATQFMPKNMSTIMRDYMNAELEYEETCVPQAANVQPYTKKNEGKEASQQEEANKIRQIQRVTILCSNVPES